MGIHNNISEIIGNTPLVKLNRVSEGVDATMVAKLEYMNPGGSVKDRICAAMIEEAEREGVLYSPTGMIYTTRSPSTRTL